jgi:hypothetical protein
MKGGIEHNPSEPQAEGRRARWPFGRIGAPAQHRDRAADELDLVIKQGPGPYDADAVARALAVEGTVRPVTDYQVSKVTVS